MSMLRDEREENMVVDNLWKFMVKRDGIKMQKEQVEDDLVE